MPPIFVDARDLAERLGVRYDTILTWVRRGKLPHIRDGRGRYLFNLNTVLETLRQSPWTPGMRPPGGMVSMTPAPSRKTVDGPGPLRLARPQGGSPRHPQDPPLRGPGPIDPPEDPRPEARPQRGSPRGPTLPAGFGRPPESPTSTPWPNAKLSNRRALHLRTHLPAGESAQAKPEAIRKAAVMENTAETRSTHDLCYTIMQQGKSHGRDR